MRFMSLIACVLLAGCFQQPQKQSPPEPDPVAKANIEARRIHSQIGWVVTKKEVVRLHDGTLEGIRLVMMPTVNPPVNHADLMVYATHQFYKEFDEIKVGDTTSFIHLHRQDDMNASKASTWLAPNCPRAVELTRKYEEYKVGP